MRAARGFGPALAGLVALSAGPGALGAQEIDAGRLTIERQGRRTGTESYRIWRDAGAVRARASVAGGGAGTEFLLQADAGFRPVLYRARGDGGDAAEATLNGNRLNLHLTTEGGERWKEFLARGPVAIVEPDVAHHYLLALKALGEPAAGSRIDVIVPTRTERTTLAVSGRESDQVRIGDRAIAATRYDLELFGSAIQVWVDGTGRLLRVQNPGEGFVATRMPEQG